MRVVEVEAVVCRTLDGMRLVLCRDCHTRVGTEVVDGDSVAPARARLASCFECGRQLRIAGSNAAPPVSVPVVEFVDTPDGPERWRRAYRIILDSARRRTEQAAE